MDPTGHSATPAPCYWQFLVAASPAADYSIVVCPAILAEFDATSILRYRRFCFNTDRPQGYRQLDVSHPKIGNFRFHYSVEKLHASGAPLIDALGRQLFWSYGVMLFGAGADELAKSLVEQAKLDVAPDLAHFLTADSRFVPRRSSRKPLGTLDNANCTPSRSSVALFWRIARIVLAVSAWLVLT